MPWYHGTASSASFCRISIGVLIRFDHEDRRILDELQRRFPERAADPALRLLILELPRQPAAPANAVIRADHVRTGAPASAARKQVGLRHQVGRLVAAPTVALNADALRFTKPLSTTACTAGSMHLSALCPGWPVV